MISNKLMRLIGLTICPAVVIQGMNNRDASGGQAGRPEFRALMGQLGISGSDHPGLQINYFDGSRAPRGQSRKSEMELRLEAQAGLSDKDRTDIGRRRDIGQRRGRGRWGRDWRSSNDSSSDGSRSPSPRSEYRGQYRLDQNNLNIEVLAEDNDTVAAVVAAGTNDVKIKQTGVNMNVKSTGTATALGITAQAGAKVDVEIKNSVHNVQSGTGKAVAIDVDQAGANVIVRDGKQKVSGNNATFMRI